MPQSRNPFEKSALEISKRLLLETPQCIEYEKYVLGLSILDNQILEQIIPLLSIDSFFDERHKTIFSALQKLHKQNIYVDINILTDFLGNTMNDNIVKAGGIEYVYEITNVTHSIDFQNKVQTIIERQKRRKVSEITYSYLYKLHFASDFPLYESTQNISIELANIMLDKQDSNTKDISYFIDNLEIEDDEIEKGIKQTSGILTGYHDIDRIIYGLVGGDLIIIAAPPSTGKTAFTLNILKNLSLKQNIATAFFSLETSGKKVLLRMAVSESQVDSDRIRSRNMNEYEKQQFKDALSRLKTAPIKINDKAKIVLSQLRLECLRLKAEGQLGLIAIDYLQLMGNESTFKNKNDIVGEISTGLRAIAKDFDVPIIAISQLNRAVEGNDRRSTRNRAVLSDLRDSGQIEQDADIVIFLYKPEKYGYEEVEVYGENVSSKGIIIADIAKNKDGQIGDVPLRWDGAKQTFSNYDGSPCSFNRPKDVTPKRFLSPDITQNIPIPNEMPTNSTFENEAPF